MSSRRKSHLLERLDGLGKVYRDEKQIAQVRYLITVRLEIIVSATPSGTHQIPGHQDVTGRIVVVDGERTLPEDSFLILEFPDGRRWEFRAVSLNPMSAEYSVLATGKPFPSK